MCQVLALTNMKHVVLKKSLNDIGNTMLASDDDGFGFAIQGKDGVFGEKTIAKKFRTRIGRLNMVTLPIVKKTYLSFGMPSELIGPGIFHGRSSTNHVSLTNTHPMQIDNWHLIHNGVVDDSGPKYAKKTTNDSEDVLRRLIDGVGKENPMEDIERFLEGYYAFAAIDPMGRLHICRDDNAPLCIAKSAKYDTYIIGTTDSLILKVSKILDAKIGPIEEIEDNVYMIFEGNNLVYRQDFNPLGYTSRQGQHMSTSLHHQRGLEDWGGWSPNGRHIIPGKFVHNGRTITAPVDVSETRVCGLQPPQRVPTSFDDAADIELDETTEIADVEVSEDGLVSEAEWQSRGRVHDATVEGNADDSLMDFLIASHNEKMDKTTPETYATFRDELDNMDAAYEIKDVNGSKLSLIEFRKLDPVHQEMCSIIRPDGTVVDLENYHEDRLPIGRKA